MKITTAITRLNKFTEENYPEHVKLLKQITDDYLLKKNIKFKELKKTKKRNKVKKQKKKKFFTKESYSKYLDSAEWKERRDFVLRKRGKVCERCGSTEKLRVHHTYYWKI